MIDNYFDISKKVQTGYGNSGNHYPVFKSSHGKLQLNTIIT